MTVGEFQQLDWYNRQLSMMVAMSLENYRLEQIAEIEKSIAEAVWGK